MNTNVNPAKAKPSTYQSGVVTVSPLRSASWRGLRTVSRPRGHARTSVRSALASYRSVPEPPHARSADRARGRMARWTIRSPSRTTAYVGLGANLGDAPRTLAAALVALAALPDARLVGVSRLYRTRPVGVVDQPAFHNAAAALEVPAGPDLATGALALLGALKSIERAFGRRARERWGPRELDLDLLLFGSARLRVERPPRARGVEAHTRGRRLAGGATRVGPGAALRPRAARRPRARPRAARLGRRRRGDGARRASAVEGPDAVVPVAWWDATGGRWVADPSGEDD